MALHIDTSIHHAKVEISAFDSFAVFRFSDPEADGKTDVFLTPEQTAEIAEAMAAAVAAFRANGNLPAATPTVSGIEDTEIPADLPRAVLDANADDDLPF